MSSEGNFTYRLLGEPSKNGDGDDLEEKRWLFRRLMQCGVDAPSTKVHKVTCSLNIEAFTLKLGCRKTRFFQTITSTTTTLSKTEREVA
jgi:hypothetical protein